MSSTIPVVTRLISQFDLKPHPEGGYYSESYRCDEMVMRKQSGATRSASTAIYYLLSGTAYSSWHRMDADEIWHFYAGGTLVIYSIEDGGKLVIQRLGHALDQEDTVFQAVVPAGCWFAAERADSDGYAFVGCTVAPGFEFEAFQIADAADLQARYPQHAALIRRLRPRQSKAIK